MCFGDEKSNWFFCWPLNHFIPLSPHFIHLCLFYIFKSLRGILFIPISVFSTCKIPQLTGSGLLWSHEVFTSTTNFIVLFQLLCCYALKSLFIKAFCWNKFLWKIFCRGPKLKWPWALLRLTPSDQTDLVYFCRTVQRKLPLVTSYDQELRPDHETVVEDEML